MSPSEASPKKNTAQKLRAARENETQARITRLCRCVDKMELRLGALERRRWWQRRTAR